MLEVVSDVKSPRPCPDLKCQFRRRENSKTITIAKLDVAFLGKKKKRAREREIHQLSIKQ